jgi:pimeloyl-ACP methyl ester carboxylesterase
MSKSLYIWFLISAAFIGCSDDVSEKPEDIKSLYLVSADSITTISLETMKNIATVTGQPAELVKHGVTKFRIVYKTTYNGTPVEASGLIYVPQNPTKPAPLMSLQHGTAFRKNQAPSVSGEFIGVEFFASAGYITVLSDYLGYGSSSSIFHPYYEEKHSALSVIDFIKSAKEFLDKKKIAFTDQLFMAGYSEGGYVTLAAANEIERNPGHDLKITAVAAGAGGYDLNEMLKVVTTETYYDYPAYLAFVIMSYNNTYGWNKPLSYFFQEPYAKALETYMTGLHDGGQINSKLTTDVEALLNPDFYQGLKASDGELEFKQAVKENSIDGWKTSFPVQLYHGTKDEIIPYKNSEITLENFKRSGSEEVSLTLFEGATHTNAYIPMLQQFVPWFETLRTD